MIRKTGAIVIGVIVAIALITIVQLVSHGIYPPPTDTNFEDPEALAKLLADAPVGALLLVVASYVAGAFGGGLVAALIARAAVEKYAYIVGGFVLAGTVLNFYQIPHPVWFAATAIVAVVATTYLTGLAAKSWIKVR